MRCRKSHSAAMCSARRGKISTRSQVRTAVVGGRAETVRVCSTPALRARARWHYDNLILFLDRMGADATLKAVTGEAVDWIAWATERSAAINVGPAFFGLGLCIVRSECLRHRHNGDQNVNEACRFSLVLQDRGHMG